MNPSHLSPILKSARADGLSLGTLQILTALADGRPLHTMGEIAEAIGSTTAGITGLADALEARNLVRRVRDPKRRTVIHLHITEMGVIVLDRLFQTTPV